MRSKTFMMIAALMACVASRIDARTTYINSLPFNVYSTMNGDTIKFQSNVHRLESNTNGIIVGDNVHDVLIDLRGDTLIFGKNGSTPQGISPPIGDKGIVLAPGSGASIYNVTIRGGYLLHRPPADSTTATHALWAVDIRLAARVHDVVIDGVYCRIFGRNSKCMMDYWGGSYNVEIVNCVFDDNMNAFADRQMWADNAMVVFTNSNTTNFPGFRFHYKVHACSTATAHWCNLYLHGDSTVADVYDNYFSADARNDAGSGFPTTAAQCYSVSLRAGTSSSGVRIKVHNNRFRSGTSFAGGRGVFLAGIKGISLHPDSSINIYSNDFVVHQGFDGEERTLNGIIARQGWANVMMRGNTVVCVGDTSVGTSSYDRGPICGIRLTGPGAGMRIVGNTVRTYFIGGFQPDYTDNGTFAAGIIFDEWQMNLPNVAIDSNTFESNSLGIKWGFYNGYGGNVLMRDNAYAFYGGSGGRVFFLGRGGGGTHNSYNNVILDGTFSNGASDTSIFVNDGDPDSLSIFLAAILSAQVIGNNGLTVSGAEVWFKNNYGATVAHGFTGSNGIFAGNVNYWWDGNAVFRGGDSTRFNPFIVKVKKGTDSTSTSYNVRWNSRLCALTLSNTPGDGGGGDNTPPGPVRDLNAIPGQNDGEVELTWTAPADDGGSQSVSYYQARRADFPINEANWNTAIPIAGLPAPLPPGGGQSFTLTGLDIGQLLFFAIKAYDEVGNESGISNVPSSYPRGIPVPIPTDTEVHPDSGFASMSARAVECYTSVYYEFHLDSVYQFPNPVVRVDLLADTLATVTFDSLSQGITYYWRCRAKATNNSDSSGWSLPISFDLLTGANEIYSQDDCKFPAMDQTIGTLLPTLEVRSRPGISQVFFQVADNPAFESPLESGMVRATGDSIIAWTVPGPIVAGAIHFWRISADNQLWTAPIRFTAVLDIHPYPNPFRAYEGHENVTFTNLLNDSEVIVASVSGDIVYKASHVGPGDWRWNVKSTGGRELASGVYLYSISSNAGSKMGKLLVIR